MKNQIFLVVGIIFTSYLVNAQNVDSVLNNYFNAIGGIESWQNLSSLQLEVDVWQNLNYNGIKNDTNIVDDFAPNKHVTYIKFPSFMRKSVYPSISKGGETTLFIRNKNKQVVKTHGRYINMPLKDINEELEALYILKLKKQGLLEYTGKIALNDKMCFVLSHIKDKRLFFFDRSSHLLVASKSTPDSEKIISYSDYRRSENILLPFKKIGKIREITYYREKITVVLLNSAMPDELFSIN